ncbi:MAG TPA: DUF4902 domain-containing protein [Rhodanobacteraceae bacterium]|nr:DUF4902 domain-containing protein [Rhodanobacteraceae bacterium]
MVNGASAASRDKPLADPSGYVRLTANGLRQLRFARRLEFEDHSLGAELTMQGLPVLAAGYCDWVDDSSPCQVLLGWAWYQVFGDVRRRLAPGGFSHNLLLLRRDGRPWGRQAVERLLRAWLSTQSWQVPNHGPCDLRYRPAPCLH